MSIGRAELSVSMHANGVLPRLLLQHSVHLAVSLKWEFHRPCIESPVFPCLAWAAKIAAHRTDSQDTTSSSRTSRLGHASMGK